MCSTPGNVTGTGAFNQNSFVACEKTSMKRDDEQISSPSKEPQNEHQSI